MNKREAGGAGFFNPWKTNNGEFRCVSFYSRQKTLKQRLEDQTKARGDATKKTHFVRVKLQPSTLLPLSSLTRIIFLFLPLPPFLYMFSSYALGWIPTQRCALPMHMWVIYSINCSIWRRPTMKKGKFCRCNLTATVVTINLEAGDAFPRFVHFFPFFSSSLPLLLALQSSFFFMLFFFSLKRLFYFGCVKKRNRKKIMRRVAFCWRNKRIILSSICLTERREIGRKSKN